MPCGAGWANEHSHAMVALVFSWLLVFSFAGMPGWPSDAESPLGRPAKIRAIVGARLTQGGAAFRAAASRSMAAVADQATN